MKRFAVFLLVLALAVVTLAVVATLRTPGHLWLKSQAFGGCPARPSCVSSRATDEAHRIEAFRAAGDPVLALKKLQAVVAGMPGAQIAHTAPGYLHAVFVSPKMGYRDDLELLASADGTIDVRSISRFGYRDFGVNRARVEDLRRRYAQAG